MADGKVGRKSKLTKERVDKICDALRKGNYVQTACQSVGISQTTYYKWKELGEQGVEPYKTEFLEPTQEAEALGELALQENIYDCANEGNWTASAWILERKYPNRWARTERVDLSTQNNDFKIQIESKKSNHQMEDDELELLKDE